MGPVVTLRAIENDALREFLQAHAFQAGARAELVHPLGLCRRIDLRCRHRRDELGAQLAVGDQVESQRCRLRRRGLAQAPVSLRKILQGVLGGAEVQDRPRLSRGVLQLEIGDAVGATVDLVILGNVDHAFAGPVRFSRTLNLNYRQPGLGIQQAQATPCRPPKVEFVAGVDMADTVRTLVNSRGFGHSDQVGRQVECVRPASNYDGCRFNANSLCVGFTQVAKHI